MSSTTIIGKVSGGATLYLEELEEALRHLRLSVQGSVRKYNNLGRN